MIKNCLNCDLVFYCKPSKQHKKFYCSKQCMAAHYKIRMKGENNPNFRNSFLKTCKACKKYFEDYSKKRKFCSRLCFYVSGVLKNKRVPERKPKKNYYVKKTRIKKKRPMCPICNINEVKTNHHRTCSRSCSTIDMKNRKVLPSNSIFYKKLREKRKNNRDCLFCKKEFYANRKSNRKYCSYECHVKNGGGTKAGKASAKMRKNSMGYKKDANHNEIVKLLRDAYIPFYDLSACGCGIPDGIVWVNNAWQLIEIKNPKTSYGRKGLNELQKKWISSYNGGILYIIRTIDDVEMLIKGKFEFLEQFSGK